MIIITPRNSLIGALFYLFVGYLVGAVLSDHIFLDLAATHWTSLWTYFWLLLWPVGLAIYFWVAVLCVGLAALAAYGIYRLFSR